MKSSFERYSVIAVTAAIAIVPQVAHSQTTPKATVLPTSAAEEDATREIVVTAQKRVENVQQVPIAITVVSADQLARRGTQSIQDLAQASASLEFTSPAAAPGGGAFVRGIGTNQVGNATSASSVSVVLDGVVLGNANINDIFDTERVEVLKGPQGTLFGSSVSAGVLNITTRAPRLGETSGYISGEGAVRALGSGYNRGALRGAINVPISETSALRLSGYVFDNNRLTHDLSDGKDSNQLNFGVRARFLWDITDNLTFNLIGDYNYSRGTNLGGYTWRATASGSLLGQALASCGLKVSQRNTDNCAGFPNSDTNQIGGISGQFDLKLGSMTLTSISSYRHVSDRTIADIISLAPNIARSFLQSCDFIQCTPVVSLTSGTPGNPQRSSRSLVTQEVRLSSDKSEVLEWVIGAYYQRADFSAHKPGVLIVHPVSVGSDLILGQGVQNVVSSGRDVATFGNATLHLGEFTRVIAGGRYTHSYVSENDADPINTGVSNTFSLRTTANALTWRAGLQHDFGSATMTYATVSTGYKAPQISDALSATDHTLKIVQAERPISYEVGFKQTLIGNRLYFDADLFYTDARHFQTQSCTSNINGIICSDINVSQVVSKGAEFEMFGRLGKLTTVNLSGIYNIARYPENFLGADLTNLSHHQVNYAPKFKMTLSAEQEIPLSEKDALVLGADATIRTKQSMYLSAAPQFEVGSQALINARITLKHANSWSVSAFVRNLTNRIYPVQLYPTTAFAQGGLWQLLDPNSQRTVGVQFQVNF